MAIDDAIARAADTLRPVCQQRGAAFILNDRPDLAVRLDCDGVHVGQEDMPYAEARRIVGPDRQVGVTCKASRRLAMEAAEAGANHHHGGMVWRSRFHGWQWMKGYPWRSIGCVPRTTGTRCRRRMSVRDGSPPSPTR